MAQDKAVTNSTADKGIKVSKGNLRALKGRLNSSQTKKPSKIGRPPVIIDYEKLTGFASQNIENYKIAEALGISTATFYRFMNEDPNFKAAYEQGMENRKYELEKALYKRASGFEATETVVEKDETGEVIKTKVTNKSYVPDTTAAIFALKNVYSEKYKDRIETVTDININVNQINQLSDSELAKIASSAVIDNIDYSIE
jgi:hypothetical protein